jgi:hypothetical protein
VCQGAAIFWKEVHQELGVPEGSSIFWREFCQYLRRAAGLGFSGGFSAPKQLVDVPPENPRESVTSRLSAKGCCLDFQAMVFNFEGYFFLVLLGRSGLRALEGKGDRGFIRQGFTLRLQTRALSSGKQGLPVFVSVGLLIGQGGLQSKL